MRPLALEVEGLTAFRHPQSVDLADLDLFVITGPTGAGKSSVLDAMTLALYGRVCRAERPAELKDLITHNSKVAKVQLDFEVGGKRYRITRRLPSRGSPAAVLEREEDGELLLDVEASGARAIDRRIEDLLGLDFDAYTKAVLLPQGRFHEFLSGEASNRRTILTRLLELERYAQMGSLARQKAREMEIRLEGWKTRLDEDYADATAESLAEARERVVQTESKASGLEASFSAINTAVDQVRVCEERIQSLRAAVEPIEGLMTEIQTLREGLSTVNRRERESAAALDGAQEALDRARRLRSEAEQTLREALERHGNEAVLTELLQATRTVAVETEKLGAVEVDLAQIKGEREERARALTDARAAKQEADEVVESCRARGEELREAFDLAQKMLAYADARGHHRLAEDEAKTAIDELRAASEARDRARQALEHLQRQHQAADLQRHLQVGDSCPVCEQVVETLPKGQLELDALIHEAAATLSEAEARRRTAEEDASVRRGELFAAEAAMNDLLKSLPAGSEPQDRAGAQAAVGETESALARTRDEFRAAVEGQRQSEEALENASRDLVAAETRSEERERESGDLRRRIDEAHAHLIPRFGEQLPLDVASKLEQQLAHVKGLRDAAEAAIQAHDESVSELERARLEQQEVQRELDGLKMQVAQVRAVALQAAQSIQARVPDAPLVPGVDSDRGLKEQLDGVSALCLSTSEAAGKAIAGENLRIESLRARMVEIAQVHGLPVEGVSPEEISECVAASLKRAERERDLAADRITNLERRIEKRAEIEQAIAAEQQERGLHVRLALELQSDRFIAYVLGESMSTLAAIATVELKKITGGRYSVEPRETNFVVVDHENADERRSVATLSGGETFLASLALALALSGSVRDLAGNAAAARVESMFIDEGFGALDGETLDTAVDALERLAEEHRMIGVISHVPALAERIQAGLDVRKVGVSSTITRR